MRAALLLVFAALGWGQETPVRPPEPAKPLAMVNNRSTRHCAVPLLEHRTQAGVEFFIKQKTPAANLDSRMPVLPPMPSCGTAWNGKGLPFAVTPPPPAPPKPSRR